MVYALINEGKVDGKKTIGLELMKGDNEQLIEVEDATPDGGLYMNHGKALFSGRRVKLDHVPKQMKAWSEGVLPDFGRSYGLMYVSEKFKAVVKRLSLGCTN